MVGQDESLSESQSPQKQSNINQPLEQQQRSIYNTNQGQGYQYLPGQHWLADPGPSNIFNNHREQHSAEQNYCHTPDNNYFNKRAFEESYPSRHFVHNNGGCGQMCSSSRTIHHTVPSSSTTQSYRHQQQGQNQYSMTLPSLPPYFEGSTPNYNPNNIHSQYLPSCNNYSSHPYRHQSPRGQIGMGSAPSTISSTSTSATPRLKARKHLTASASPLGSRIPWRPSSEMFFYGGLSVLWRQVPEACQEMLSQNDIPDTVKTRGYFTVCELLELKRSLIGRLSGVNNKEPESHGILSPEDNVGVGEAVKQAMDTLEGQPISSAPAEGDSNK